MKFNFERSEREARKPDKKKKLFQRGSCLGIEMIQYFLLEIWYHMLPLELESTYEIQRKHAIPMKAPYIVINAIPNKMNPF